jgi:hypothetical protein
VAPPQGAVDDVTGRHRTVRRQASRLALITAGLGAACLVASAATLPSLHSAGQGRVPAGGVPSARAESSRLRAAPTVSADAARVTPAASAAGRAAALAGNPVAGNPVPMRLTRLRVPALHVDARVVDVGLTGDRQLRIPADPQVLGRWTGGAEPGEPYGSVVVAGHVDDRHETGALFRLRSLRPGDRIVAVGADRRTRTYRVSAVREVAKQQLVTRLEPFRQDVAARLVLVTCGGAFDPVKRSYADNIVVFAVPIATGHA